MKFKDLNINNTLLNNIEKLKFNEPTNVQQKAIPIIMNNDDLISIAQTGSGKTAAYLIPIINTLTKNKKTTALIMVPTRDLVNQVFDECKLLSEGMNINIIKIMGGASVDQQKEALKSNPQIIIAVIGRLKQFIKSKAITFENLQYLVLDEVDKMLDLGFRSEVLTLIESIKNANNSFQLLMFSATFPKSIQELSKKYLNDNYKYIDVSEDKTINHLVKQTFLVMDKTHMVSQLLKCVNENNVQTIIFCNTIKECINIENLLHYIGINCKSIHGDRSQAYRNNIINNFKNYKISVLIATDVLARGIDIKGLDLVINFNLPEDDETYMHRIGRVGRNKTKGRVISITSLSNEKNVNDLIKKFNLEAKIVKKDLWTKPNKENIKESINLYYNKHK